MDHIFKYAIILAIPDLRRGERVNVGIIVFLDDKLDIRFSDLEKITAIAGGANWADYADRVSERLHKRFLVDHDPIEFVRKAAGSEQIIRFSEIAWFSIPDEMSYEARISDILISLVKKPRPENRQRHVEYMDWKPVY